MSFREGGTTKKARKKNYEKERGAQRKTPSYDTRLRALRVSGNEPITNVVGPVRDNESKNQGPVHKTGAESQERTAR